MKSVVILGMHRSGTSAVAKALSNMGVDLGKNLLSPKEDNKKGFWEDHNLVDFNTRLMQSYIQDWNTFGPLAQSFPEESYDEVIRYINSEFGGSSVWGFKDPRTSRLIPFWNSVFEKMKLDVVYCVVIRNPLSVIQSLEKRNQFSAQHAALLWYQYNMDIIAGLVDVPFTVIDYDSLLVDPEKNLIRLAKGIGQADSLSDVAINEYCQEFLSCGLRNSKFTLDSLNTNDDIPNKIAELYRELLRLTNESSVYLPSHLKDGVELWESSQSSNGDIFKLLNNVIQVESSKSAKLSHCNSSLDIALSHVEKLLKERDHVINERDIMENRHQMAVTSLEESQNKVKSVIESKTSLEEDFKAVIESKTSLEEDFKAVVESKTSLEEDFKAVIESNTSLEEEIKLITNYKTNIENELDSIYKSNSWKFTSPLRRIISILKR